MNSAAHAIAGEEVADEKISLLGQYNMGNLFNSRCLTTAPAKQRENLFIDKRRVGRYK